MRSLLDNRPFKTIAGLATALALIVVVLGAYVRLSDAGLGCPDWPGCYGELFMSDAGRHADIAAQSGYERPYEHDKAWKEMAHRYLAAVLGLLILAMAVLGWRYRALPGQPCKVPLLLVGLVIFQAALGMWTVTLLLKPAVVTLHLLGGMSVLALIWWSFLRTPSPAGTPPAVGIEADRRLAPLAVLALVVIAAQITLGGWVSTNYAALICADLPTCQGRWWPPMDFADGFTFWRGLGVDYEYGVLGPEAMTAVHVSHRIGAVVTLLVVGAVAARVMIRGSKTLRRSAVVLLLLLFAQLALGVANIVWMLPLPLAVAHNAGAALLLLAAVTLLHQTTARGDR